MDNGRSKKKKKREKNNEEKEAKRISTIDNPSAMTNQINSIQAIL